MNDVIIILMMCVVLILRENEIARAIVTRNNQLC